ncbi:MAG: D-alanyl-D-alanine carboxypeptidase family protein [Eubacteriales bacterium]|nr:D-alanyl-D-alanine carboxypeptidase family protein [Christensenellaceae bacterium]MEA5066886.1 D-alanyl-D-alanine carboxypeptidase family protein [Eubacteriales bacterium]
MRRKVFFAALLALSIAASAWSAAPAPASTTPLPFPMGEQVARAEATPPNLTAKAAIVIDADTGKALFEKNADQRRAPASTTKLMTLLLAVEHGGLDKVVTLPESAGKAPVGSSLTPVYPGEKMPMRDLLHALTIKSGNDAANAIGTIVSGSVNNFVAAMNARAEKMGLENTHFVNPHGFPADGHYSSARDLARITREVLQNATCRRIIETRSHTMKPTARRGALKLTNGYAILDKDSDYYYAPAFGVKTGYSVSSGQCFVGAAAKGGHTLISVVLHSAQTKPEKWIDTRKLMEYGFQKLGA